MTRKRFVKLFRALSARARYPDLDRIASRCVIRPKMHLSYDRLWAPYAYMASIAGVGEKRRPVPCGITAGRKGDGHGR